MVKQAVAVARKAATRPGGEWFQVAGTDMELMRAVVDTFDQLTKANQKPSAESWLINDGKFQGLRDLIVARWAAITKQDPKQFPFRDDFIKWAWITYRKSSSEKDLKALRSWVGVE